MADDAAGPEVRKGQWPGLHPREVFRERFLAQFTDPAYRAEQDALTRLEAIAWDAYREGARPRHAQGRAGVPGSRLRPVGRVVRHARAPAAGAGALERAGHASRVLVVACSGRNDGSCPGEMSKTFRLAKIAQDVLDGGGVETDLLDLSLLTSDYRRHIHPCKGCVSTAMPLCHWPCSCYPNHATGQVGDWMAEIYERWVSAHGVLLVTPTHWYQVSSPLKLMMDRLVCADGGNPDPTRTSGKDARKAKEIELAGWDYPKHLAGAPTAWWCTATSPASKARAAPPATGWTGWGWSTPVRARGWTATSATTSPMRPATPTWTATPTCRKKCATSPVRCSKRWRSCAGAN
jgi:multimeric flavodoxin WrbA